MRKKKADDMEQARIRVDRIDYTIDNTPILHDITLQIGDGELVGLIGPNGCGKTTFLKNIYRIYKPTKGAVYLDGKNIREMTAKDIAKKMSVLPQERMTGFDFPVLEVVLMGRYAHKRLLESNNEQDLRICEQALMQVDMAEFCDRGFLSLSGGEKQRVLLAAAFAQEAGVIILDEPTNHLDIGYQLIIMDIIRAQPMITVFASLHDMNIAAQYCDRVIAMDKGRIIASGTPEEVLTEPIIERLFQVKSRIIREPATGKLNITYLRAVREKQ